jgi:DUF971 family protein
MQDATGGFRHGWGGNLQNSRGNRGFCRSAPIRSIRGIRGPFLPYRLRLRGFEENFSANPVTSAAQSLQADSLSAGPLPVKSKVGSPVRQRLRIKGTFMDTSLSGLRQGKHGIILTWSDGLEAELGPRSLRVSCTCARCISETTGERLLNPATVPAEIKLTAIEPIGHYAYRCNFSDGHNTGLFTLELLRELCEGSGET